jgi:hypothetical protein
MLVYIGVNHHCSRNLYRSVKAGWAPAWETGASATSEEQRGSSPKRRPRSAILPRMKLQATVVISYRADSFGDAGDALDDVLQRARERDDVEIDSVQFSTPASAGPVSLPYVETPPSPPRRVPHPVPDGSRN